MQRRAWLAAVLLVLVGCAGDPAPEPSTSSAPIQTFTARPAPDYVPEPEPSPEPAPVDSGPSKVVPILVEADPEALATMECRDATSDERTEIYRRWGASSVNVAIVEVGEGNEPGVVWSVVYYETTDDRWNYILALVDDTTSPNGQWILPGDVYGSKRSDISWNAVKWDRERLARAQAAVERAIACVTGD